MSAKRFFLETNIVVYTFDHIAPQKQNVAQQLMEKSMAGEGCISFQVIQEFLNLALRKFSPHMSTSQAQRYLQDVLLPLCDYYPGEKFCQHGLSIQER